MVGGIGGKYGPGEYPLEREARGRLDGADAHVVANAEVRYVLDEGKGVGWSCYSRPRRQAQRVLNVADAEVRYTLDKGKGIGWPRRSRPCRVVLGGEYLLTGKRKGSESPEYSHGWRNRGKV